MPPVPASGLEWQLYMGSWFAIVMRMQRIRNEVRIMARSNPAITLSVRISPEMRAQLEELSGATGRTKSFLAAEAIESYLAVQAWQVSAIKKAVIKANNKEASFIDHRKVAEWVHSWGSEDELEMPR